MSYLATIKKFIHLIDFIRVNKNCTGKEILTRIAEYDIPISTSTLKRDLAALRDEFGIEIKYNKSTRGYYLDEEESTDSETFVKILELISTREIIQETIKENKDNLKYLSFDTSASLQGVSNLWIILDSIKNCKVIELYHESFSSSVEKKYIIQPLGLKEYANRWYVIGKIHGTDQHRTFGLDRIKKLNVKSETFKRNEKENPLDEFENIIGLVYSVHSLQKVVLSFSPLQGKYLKTLNIHHSQRTIIDNDDEFRIELSIKPNFELIQRIMMYGDDVKVMEPSWLADEIQTKLKNALKKYN